ncbi:ATP-binding protein [Chroococcus sp. FPU101]|uniref:ATP-binding protein n=1 Tax=Chroococcus sp. FPU101 TaxID=1974212 RepID=UPI001A8F8BDD|nr:ATP-binding protein [Chroococcus sp. FPU101]GFE71379.1 multi-sensor hybrid histidine kinase [Chroococcus sp. FPU101]
MPKAESKAEKIFSGGGEMGALMRSFDWSKTLLDSVEKWPQSLRTIVSVLLNSRYPMFIWWGTELVALYNDAYRPILGNSKHPYFLGKSAKEMWAEIWDTLGPLTEIVMKTGEPTWSEDLLLLMNRYGYLEETYFTFSYSPVRDETGGVGGVFCACTETTERVIGERRLQTLRDLVAKTVEAKTVEEACHKATATLALNNYDIPFALLYRVEDDQQAHLVSTTTNITPETIAYIQPQDIWHLTEVTRTKTATMVSNLTQELGELLRGAWPDATHSALVMPIAQAGQQQLASILVLGINPRRAFDDEYRGFFDLVASHIGTAVANADAYEAERRRAEALAELDRAKTVFFSNVSHEFRTPLTLMLGPLSDVLEHSENLLPNDQEQLKIAYRNSQRLLKLVNTLLDFSRIEAGRIEAVYQPTNLALFTADLAGIFRAAIERAGLRLIVDCPPLPSPAYVDREMWEKIVLNLLSNAFKFTFEGEIAVVLRSDARQITLQVRDTGTGIRAEELPRLFERFHRIKGARGRSFEGTGIGLALVQELVHLHGGTIEVSSIVDQGTCFTVFIPTGYAHLPSERIQTATTLKAAPVNEELLRWLPETLQSATSIDTELSLAMRSSIQTGRILLADDNADLREYTKRLLGQYYEIETVADGKAALSSIRYSKPDLVITDVMMPKLDGFELLRQLRSDSQTKDLPIILLSARSGEESRIEGLNAGADDYLIKPFSARELLARVEAIFKLSRLRQQTQEILQINEQRLRIAQLASQTGTWDWDLKKNIVFWSPEYYKLYGIDPTTPATYKNWLETVLEEDRDSCIQAIQKALERKQTSLIFEFRIRHPILGLRWFASRSQIFYDSEQQPIRAIGISIDITEQKHIEEALRESEQRAQLAIQVSRIGTWRYNLETNMVEFDSRMCEIWGVPVNTKVLSLTTVMEQIHLDDRPHVESAINAALDPSSSGLYEVEYRIIWPDGTEHWVFANGQILFENERRSRYLVNFFGTALDITERKQAEIKMLSKTQEVEQLNTHLSKSTAELAQRNQELDRFAYVVSHDLKAPLRAITNLSTWIEEDLNGQIPENTEHQLQLLRQRVHRMESLIDGLLVYSRAGRVEVAEKMTDVAQLVNDIIDSLMPPSTFTITTQLALLPIITKQLLLSQVFSNLISNAIKHHDRNDGRVDITGVDKGDYYEFSIYDDGPGIAAKDHERIFEIFQTLKSRDVQESTGIGLSIVKKIIETESGSIRVESELGKGTTFRFTWPVSKKS